MTLLSIRRQGRFLWKSVGDMRGHELALSACQVWLSAGRFASVMCPPFVEAVRQGDDLCWFGGFAALDLAGRDPVNVFVWRDGALTESQIARAAWAELCHPAGLRDARAMAVWYRALERNLPVQIARAEFGPRGLTHWTGADRLGVSRRSLQRALADGE